MLLWNSLWLSAAIYAFLVRGIYQSKGISDYAFLQTNHIHRENEEDTESGPPRVSGCNFSDHVIHGVEPFSNLDPGNLCAIDLSGRNAQFTYSCDGISIPPDCPTHIKHIYGTTSLSTFFEQSYTGEVHDIHSKGRGFVTFVTKPMEFFEGMCVCYRANGNKMTMRVSSGFRQRQGSLLPPLLYATLFCILWLC